MPNNTITITTTCPICKNSKELTVSYDGYVKYYELGYHVQDAFPELPIDEREMLITGICPTCWDKMFPNEEEDEEDDGDDEPSDSELGFNPYMGCYDYDC